MEDIRLINQPIDVVLPLKKKESVKFREDTPPIPDTNIAKVVTKPVSMRGKGLLQKFKNKNKTATNVDQKTATTPIIKEANIVFEESKFKMPTEQPPLKPKRSILKNKSSSTVILPQVSEAIEESGASFSNDKYKRQQLASQSFERIQLESAGTSGTIFEKQRS